MFIPTVPSDHVSGGGSIYFSAGTRQTQICRRGFRICVGKFRTSRMMTRQGLRPSSACKQLFFINHAPEVCCPAEALLTLAPLLALVTPDRRVQGGSSLVRGRRSFLHGPLRRCEYGEFQQTWNQPRHAPLKTARAAPPSHHYNALWLFGSHLTLCSSGAYVLPAESTTRSIGPKSVPKFGTSKCGRADCN